MRVAQDLYEGIEIGDEGAVGLITYMRTDSTRVAESAAQQAREYLRTLFGEEFVCKTPQLYGDGQDQRTLRTRTKAIRPTDPTRRPDEMRKYLSADQLKLYQLIWQRFMASQMTPAVFDTTTVDFDIPVDASTAAGHRPPQLSVPRHGLDREVPGLSRAVSRSARGRRAQGARGRAGAAGRRSRRKGAVQGQSRRASTSPSRRRASPRRVSSRSSSGWASVVRRPMRRSSRCSPTAGTSSSCSGASSRRRSARASRR